MSKTATKEKPPKKLVRSTKGANNGVNGRPTWQPAIQTFRANGLTGTETQEQAWERTRNWVRHCASIGIQFEVIATLVQPPCSHDTLVKYFKHELQNGAHRRQAGATSHEWGWSLAAVLAGDASRVEPQGGCQPERGAGHPDDQRG
jgi:hypothetical protein